MRKTLLKQPYAPPVLKTLHLNVSPLMNVASGNLKIDSNATLDASNDLIGLSKKYWGGTVLDDDNDASSSDY